MASLYLESENANFSKLIYKNPSSGMRCSSVKKGTLFGYYTNEQRYNAVFFDGFDEISFGKVLDPEFEYIDSTRYDSPLFVLAVLKEMFDTALNKEDELDVPAKQTICITSCEVRRKNIIDRICMYLKDYSVQYEMIEHEYASEEYDKYYHDYKLTITANKTLHEFLNFVYMLSYFLAVMNRNELNIETNVVRRIIKAANIVKAPYYVKYLIKFYFIKKTSVFAELKQDLNYDDSHKIVMKSLSNKHARVKAVSSQIGALNVLDFGCGEGEFFSLSKNVEKYYAYDISEEALAIAKRRIKKFEYNVEIVDKNFSIESDYVAVLSEVIEHNEVEEAKAILQKFMSDAKCKKIIVTTPNKDFNKYYLLDDNEKRHDDHKFEFTKLEAKAFFDNLVENTKYKYSMHKIGDVVDDTTPILMFVLVEDRNV